MKLLASASSHVPLIAQPVRALAQVAPQVRTSRSTEIVNPVFEILCAPYREAQ
ncbi:hypothetical protein [Streptomyces flaveus]|uniref:hypothetical protein n=1 Tax=Streptomyces flaveus TaxID=66370 RepID=UPI001670D934|nr:hypothetical protein [Streptomyces flaveus]